LPKSTDRFFLYLYAAGLFLSAALLFLIQPMIAKMILPFLGGSPAVWNTCMFFFQSLLLLGYLYAHLGSAWLGVKRHMVLHLAIIVAALYFLPVAVSSAWFAHTDAAPVNLVLGVLLVSVGLPFFVLSANAPLLQKWFSTAGHAAARDPYFLYAASNAGSLLGLLAYPLVLEPRMALDEQSYFWMYVYVAFVLVAVACAWLLWRMPLRAEAPLESARAIETADGKITSLRRVRWVVLSFAPSSLLLGVTTYVTTDLASVPLLWVLPLSLYLISFIIAFQKKSSWATSPFLVKRQSFLLLAAAITFFAKATEPAAILLPVHLLAFFVTALVCHGELAKDRPEPNYLTDYYLWISFGGLLGGFFNAFLAPVIFSSVWEYPLAMIAAAWVRPRLEENSEKGFRTGDVLWPAVLFAIVFALVLWTRSRPVFSAHVTHILIFGVSALMGLSFARRRARFALGIAAVLFATAGYAGSFGEVLFTERSFFGVYRAMRDTGNKFHFIFHGTTLHGAQSLDPAKRLQPLSYFYPTGPAGQVFHALSATGFDKPVAIVGLGAGALACYGKAGQAFDFYEIDPLVERIARDANLFTFMRDCPARTSVHIGDARVTLARAAQSSYGMFILDAFSGDSIPIHLLTREAVELYLTKLLPQGLLLFHISNRYMDLTKVVARVADRLHLTALVQQDGNLSEHEIAEGKQPSVWVVLAAQKHVLTPLTGDSRWKPLAEGGSGDLWTDNYSNILQVLRWK
jgi:hypothetical protein